MAETRKLQYAVRLPNGTIHSEINVAFGDEATAADDVRHVIRNWITDAKSEYGVGDDYQPELVHRVVVTHTPDWAVGEYLTEPATDPA